MVPAVLATLLLLVPLVAMVAATNWRALPDHLTSTAALDALRLSLVTSTVAIAFCLLLGLPLAWLLAFPLGLGFWGVLVARVLEEVVKIAIFTWRRRKLSWGSVIAGQTALNAATD